MKRLLVVTTLVLVGLGEVALAQLSGSAPGGAPAGPAGSAIPTAGAIDPPPAPAGATAPLHTEETGTRHPSGGGPETGYQGSNDPAGSSAPPPLSGGTPDDIHKGSPKK